MYKRQEWLERQPAVARVLFPALPDDPGHALWQKYFGGGASLFGLVLHEDSIEAVARFVDNLQHFQIGSSWGGYESLIAVNRAPLERAVVQWTESSMLLRLHIGLEDPEDLIADLEAGLARL